jgi:hypothetical protein
MVLTRSSAQNMFKEELVERTEATCAGRHGDSCVYTHDVLPLLLPCELYEFAKTLNKAKRKTWETSEKYRTNDRHNMLDILGHDDKGVRKLEVYYNWKRTAQMRALTGLYTCEF